MFTGVRAVCECGTTFPLPQEAFSSGTTCPGCGQEITRLELEGYRTARVSEFTRVSSILVLAVLVLGQIALMARPFVQGLAAEMAEVFGDLGQSLPAITTVVMRPGLVPGILAVLAIACIAIAVTGVIDRREPRRRDMRASAALLALLAIAVFISTMVTLAIRLPLIDLMRSLD